MSLFFNKKKYIFYVCTLLLFGGYASFSYAQITIPDGILSGEEDTTSLVERPFIKNEYKSLYDEVPSSAVLSVNWYKKPSDIAVMIPLGDLDVRIQYLDDVAYLEKIIDGVKGRIFLKRTKGTSFIVDDIWFVPYISIEDTDNKKKIIENNKITNDPPKQKNPIPTEYRVPRESEKELGKSIFVQIVLFQANGLIDKVFRYAEKDKIFSEYYRYTSKGALRSLTRNYEDGSVTRFVYFFNNSGLEEEFHQKANGEVFYKKYTETGSIKELAEYDKDGNVTYKLAYVFDDNEQRISEEEIKNSVRAFITYKNGQPYKRVMYRKGEENDEGNDEEKEVEISSTYYNYKKNDETSLDKSIGLLHEKNKESFFDKSGRIVKEREYEDSVLKKEITYQEDNRRIETQFFKNKPVLRIYYKGNSRIRTEIVE